MGWSDAGLDEAARLSDGVRQNCLIWREARQLMKMARPQIAGLLEGDWERLGPAGTINSSTSTRQELLRIGPGVPSDLISGAMKSKVGAQRVSPACKKEAGREKRWFVVRWG